MSQTHQDDAEAVADELYFPAIPIGGPSGHDGSTAANTATQPEGGAGGAVDDGVRKKPETERLPDHHVVFVPGNPGLISYYRPFLHSLHAHLNGPTPPTDKQESSNDSAEGRRSPDMRDRPIQPRRTAVYGTSLAGFSVSPPHPSKPPQELSDVHQQIAFVHQKLSDYASRFHHPSPASSAGAPTDSQKLQNPDNSPIPVTLMAHSIGAFVVLKLLERQHLRASLDECPYVIRGAVLLTPTIEDIAKSTNGLKARWVLGARTAGVLPPVLGMGAKILVGKLAGERAARRAGRWWIGGSHRSSRAKSESGDGQGHGKGVSEDEQEGVKESKVEEEMENAARVIVKWLASDSGVAQALHMASHELSLVTSLTDNFSADFLRTYSLLPRQEPDHDRGSITSIARPDNNYSPKHDERTHQHQAVAATAKVFLYFAANDGWVSSTTRDSLISRIRDGNRKGEADVRAETDESGKIPHAFCIGHSESMARKCAEYVSRVV